jgi:tetratricopeptide (TPR) repeat protein
MRADRDIRRITCDMTDRVPWPVLLVLVVWLITGCGFLKSKGGKSDSAESGDVVVTSAMMEVSAKYIEASREKILGNFSAAERILSECLKADPRHHPSMYQLADISHIKGDYPSALYWIGEAVKLDNVNVWYKVLQGDLLLKTGKYRDAVTVYREINLMRPGKRIWFEARAYAQKMAGDTKGATATYREILDNFGFDEAIFLKMIGIYEQTGNQKQVEESLQWLVKKFPYDTRYLGYLASHYYGRGMPAKALPLWQEILRLEPGNGEVRFELANYYRDRGEDAKAYQELKQAFTTPNLSIDAKVVVLMSYYELTEKGNRAMLDEAYQLLRIMVEKHPENPKGWSIYGDFLFRDQRYDESLNMMKRVVELDSSRYLVWELLLDCAVRTGDFTVLTNYGERALRYFPDQARFYLWHGEGLFHMERYAEALEVYRKGYFFSGLGDTHLTAALIHGMARSSQESGDMQKAGEHYQRAIEKGGPYPALMADYAAFLATMEQNDKLAALKQIVAAGDISKPLVHLASLRIRSIENPDQAVSGELTALITSQRSDYQLLERAGLLWYDLGNKSAAIETWQKALLVSKGNLFIESLIKKATP